VILAPRPAQRVFVGKARDRSANVLLSDAQGRGRLALRVDADGNASIEFLDANSNIGQRLEPGKWPFRSLAEIVDRPCQQPPRPGGRQPVA